MSEKEEMEMLTEFNEKMTERGIYDVLQLLKVQDEIGYAQGEIRYYSKSKNCLGAKQAKARLRKLRKEEKRMKYGNKKSALPI